LSEATFDPALATGQTVAKPRLDQGMNFGTFILFMGILGAGLLFVAYSIYQDIEAAGTPATS
jgi:PiT family inorganic phosphate transporter